MINIITTIDSDPQDQEELASVLNMQVANGYSAPYPLLSPIP